ncbi:hypothetical protein WA556_006161 [Blastocystis sp. ATCC 50177/Nand II]
MDKTAFVYDRLEIKEEDSLLTRLKKVSLRALYFCELNGSYIALYCLMLPGILMNVLSALFNEFQGGREGYNRVIFVASTLVSFIPWLIFSMYYMFTNWSYAQFVIPNIFSRGVFDFLHLLIFIFITHSNICFVVTSLFDILNYPDFHSSVTTKLALYGCIALFIDVVCSKLYLKSIWEKQKWRKVIYMLFSWVFALSFGLLYYVRDCPAQIVPMDLCFTLTSEDYCFLKQDQTNTSMTILRYYPHCSLLNFARGICEYMLLLMSMCYLSFLRGDIIIEQYEMMKWKYFNEVTIVNGKRSRAASNISEIEDTREKEEMTKKANEAVKNMIEHTSNIYLLKA